MGHALHVDFGHLGLPEFMCVYGIWWFLLLKSLWLKHRCQLDDELFRFELVDDGTASSATPPATANTDAKREVKLRRLRASPGVTRNRRLPDDCPLPTGVWCCKDKTIRLLLHRGKLFGSGAKVNGSDRLENAVDLCTRNFHFKHFGIRHQSRLRES